MALIRDSREQGTATLARALAALPRPPRTLLCASAIGFYGFEGQAPVDETAPKGGGFLADVCGRWEAAADPARAAGLRVAHLRLGLVLSPAGGMLKTLLPVFRAGAGGVVGPGTQGMSWVGLDDVVGAFHHALFDDTLAGPVNVTAPEPVSNAAFTQALGRALHRPTLVPAPRVRAAPPPRAPDGRRDRAVERVGPAGPPRGGRLSVPPPHARRRARPLPAVSPRSRPDQSGRRPV